MAKSNNKINANNVPYKKVNVVKMKNSKAKGIGTRSMTGIQTTGGSAVIKTNFTNPMGGG